MIKNLLKDKKALFVVALFLGLTAWWVFLRVTTKPDDLQNQLFAAVYGAMALFGGIFGVLASKKWGGAKSILGRAILMFALGLLLQEFGQLAYSYYIYFAKITVPYPSVGDIGYFGSIPLYLYGITLLAKASGAKVSLRSFAGKFISVLLPVAILAGSYFLLIKGYRSFSFTGSPTDKLRTLLDFGYPFGQAFYLSVAILAYFLSRKLLGGIMRNKILFVLAALLMQYASDFTFIYQSNKQTWFAGGLNDYMYLVAYFLMTLALLNLRSTESPQPEQIKPVEPVKAEVA